MIRRSFISGMTLLAALPLSSCDKARNLADKAKSVVQDKIAENESNQGSKGDPELQKSVDQTAEGVIFRKDLPFPPRIEIRTTRRRSIECRLLSQSAFEKRAESISGTEVRISKIERASHHVRYTLEESSFSVPSKDPEKNEDHKITNPLELSTPITRPINFRKKDGKWTADTTNDFRSAVVAKQISPVFERLLADHAAAPRPLWFSKRRFKPGDRIEVTGETLPMLMEGAKKGAITLVLESFEAVDGHPCAVFQVSGDYARKDFPDFDGAMVDEDVTISSGKMWFSLIYPIILREELETIQTFSIGPGGSQASRGQGSVKISAKRSWKSI
jgi:hypothetical protein